jgi:hypothetical protein
MADACSGDDEYGLFLLAGLGVGFVHRLLRGLWIGLGKSGMKILSSCCVLGWIHG